MPNVSAGQRVTGTALSLGYSSGDVSAITVTAATTTALTKQWSIPASDAAAGTCYRVTSWGNGTEGTTSQGLHFNIQFAGATMGTTTFIGSGNFAISQPFTWYMQLTLMCITTGVTGTWTAGLLGIITETNNTVNIGTVADESVPITQASTAVTTADSTIAQAFYLSFSWGSATGAPTITSRGSLFEKLGG